MDNENPIKGTKEITARDLQKFFSSYMKRSWDGNFYTRVFSPEKKWVVRDKKSVFQKNEPYIYGTIILNSQYGKEYYEVEYNLLTFHLTPLNENGTYLSSDYGHMSQDFSEEWKDFLVYSRPEMLAFYEDFYVDKQTYYKNRFNDLSAKIALNKLALRDGGKSKQEHIEIKKQIERDLSMRDWFGNIINKAEQDLTHLQNMSEFIPQSIEEQDM